MNVARQHNEWLSLVDRNGPFVSLPVLLRVFPQGLDRRDPERVSRLREAYDEWRLRGVAESAVHHFWVRHVLASILEYQGGLLLEGQAIPAGIEAPLPAFGETLRPDLVLQRLDAHTPPVLLLATYSPNQDLNKPLAARVWKASPATRMAELLHATDVPIGLVTNGEQWMLVSARPKETSGFTTWHADLWMQEPLTLRAFHSLLHLRRLIGVAETDTLPAMLSESSQDQQEVTDQLGYQVREAVEVLVQAFDQIDAESGRRLLAGVNEKDLYDSALTVMMRLVFLSAEERGLLLLGDPQYDQNYAVSTLSELLRERADQHGEEVLERRHDAWCRLLATFRAVHGGVEHEAMRLPAYGGTLFNPDKYPFLEGRVSGSSWKSSVAQPVRIDNRVVLHLLEALQFLRAKGPGGASSETRRLSFSELGVEQIGHVYEGLLDHTAKRADQVFLGLTGAKDQEPEVALATLEEASTRGIPALVELLHDETGRSTSALERLLMNPPPLDEHAMVAASGHDETLARRMKPFAPFLRTDSFGRLVVVRNGQIFVTRGLDRRSTGTHYTPPSLTEPIVRCTLEPLVYLGPAEGLPPAEWTLKNAKAILALRVCDMAMGSGAFLVEVCRYLGDRLVESWEISERAHPGSFVVTPDGELSTGSSAERLMPIDAAERVALARRYVADRCLYGVDINPMAVEMAKLSIWLTTSQRDRPFTFLDHVFKCGDSLLGVSAIEQIENFSLRAGEHQGTFATASIRGQVEASSAARQALQEISSKDYSQIENKNRLHAKAEAATATVKALSDALVAFELRAGHGSGYEERRVSAVAEAELALARPFEEFLGAVRTQLAGRSPFHWPLEFPEVWSGGGFDALVGDPLYRHGSRISADNGRDYLRHLVDHNEGVKGTSNLAVYFLRRTVNMCRPSGAIGIVVTKSIAEGDNKQSGLGWILQNCRFVLYSAISRMTWPGQAGLVVSVIHGWLGDWHGRIQLDGTPVVRIGEALREAESHREVHELSTNASLCYKGSELLGDGFILTEDEAARLVAESPRVREVVKPLVNGKEFASMPQFRPSRWVIDFGEMSEQEARRYPAAFDIVERLVKPERAADNRPARRDRFWRFGEVAKGLYARLADCPRAIARLFTCEYWFWDFFIPGPVVTNGLVVVADSSAAMFCVLTSAVHETWAASEASSLVTRFRYTPSRCFETFPFPQRIQPLEGLGERYRQLRQEIMITRGEGLTKTYSRLHERRESSDDIKGLRELRADLDRAVASAYGWQDLRLEHAFHQRGQVERYTVSETDRSRIQERLLALNYEHHSRELTAGTRSPRVANGRRPHTDRPLLD